MTTTYSKPGYKSAINDPAYIIPSITGPKASAYSKRDYRGISASTDEANTTYSKRDYSASTDEITTTTKTSYDQVGDAGYNADDYYDYSSHGGHPIYVGSNYKSKSHAKSSSLGETERSYLTESFTPKDDDEYYGHDYLYPNNYHGGTSSLTSNNKSNDWYGTSADDYFSSGNNYSGKTYDGYSVRAAGKPSDRTVSISRQPYNKRVSSSDRIRKLKSNRIRSTRSHSRGGVVNPREAVMKYDSAFRAKISKVVPWSRMSWEERLDVCRDHET